MTSISGFLSKFKYGARSNLFRVYINDFGMDDIEFLAKATSLPGRTHGVTELKYKNNIVKIPGDTSIFPEWSVTVINDESFKTRLAFEDWMEKMKSSSDTFSLNLNPISEALSVVSGSAEIEILSPDLSVLASYKIFNMFPIDLGSIDLSWDSSDTIQEYSVTFAYNFWRVQ